MSLPTIQMKRGRNGSSRYHHSTQVRVWGTSAKKFSTIMHSRRRISKATRMRQKMTATHCSTCAPSRKYQHCCVHGHEQRQPSQGAKKVASSACGTPACGTLKTLTGFGSLRPREPSSCGTAWYCTWTVCRYPKSLRYAEMETHIAHMKTFFCSLIS